LFKGSLYPFASIFAAKNPYPPPTSFPHTYLLLVISPFFAIDQPSFLIHLWVAIKQPAMKKLFFFFLTVTACETLTAQNVGIGLSSNINKKLTVKGDALFVFPAGGQSAVISLMGNTNNQGRINFIRPDSSVIGSIYGWDLNDRMYLQQGSNTNQIVLTSNGNVGINNAAPSERLDVLGNIRSRDTITADNDLVAGDNVRAGGDIIATGIVSGNGLQSSGGLTVSSNGLIGGNFTSNGNLSTNSDLIVNNSGATLQLKNGSNVNTGFFQLSGNNVRMGTNSGNNTGNLIIRMNGTDRVSVDEVGNVNISGELRKTSVTGTASLTPYCYGSVSGNGIKKHGTSNFSSERLQQGYYRIRCAGITYSNCVILVTSGIRSRLLSTIGGIDEFDLVATDLSNNEIDTAFDFVIFKM
jgi:hypothetical protein